MTIRGLTLRNRLAMSPMCMYSAHDGFANALFPFSNHLPTAYGGQLVRFLPPPSDNKPCRSRTWIGFGLIPRSLKQPRLKLSQEANAE
jgi:hypothetical protein